MNILHINNTDLIGGRFNGYNMLHSPDKSFNVEMAVWKKESHSAYVYKLPPTNSALRFVASLTAKLSLKIGLDKLTGNSGRLLPGCDYFKRAEIIHLHLIHNLPNFSILSLPKLSRQKPIVWTIHDPWAMTGGCEHSFDCNRWLTGCTPRCPHPRCRALFQHYMPYFHWRIKRWVYQRTDLTLIVASQWMKDRIAQSPLLSHLPCYQIPFGIDLEVFKKKPKNDCRKKLGIPSNHKVIAFRDIDNRLGPKLSSFKGRGYLMDALKIYEPLEPTTLLIFEDGHGFKSLAPKYNVVTPGWLDGENLSDALSAADVFMMPSIQESFGLMAVEAMACGIPVIVFDGTALPDVIKSPRGGIVVPAKNSVALARAMNELLADDELRNMIGKQARQVAEDEYSFALYMQRHMILYETVLERHRKV